MEGDDAFLEYAFDGEDFSSSYLEDPRIRKLKIEINDILDKLRFTTTRYSDYWTYDDYEELYRLIHHYKFEDTSKWLPFKYKDAQDDVKLKITGINMRRRDSLFRHYGVKDDKDEYNFLNLKKTNPSAFVKLMPLMKLDEKRLDMHLRDLETRRKGLSSGGRTTKGRKRRTNRVKKRKLYRQFRR
jgi:hypothetical protein